jgi:hypothetical protein
VTNISSTLQGIEDLDCVSYKDSDEKFYYVVSDETCSSKEFRSAVSKYIYEKEGLSTSLEIRTKEDKDGYIGIVGSEVEHPVQLTTIISGVLDLSDRYTSQSLIKTNELADELYDGRNVAEFSVAVVIVVSSIIDSEPLDVVDVANQTGLKANKIQSQIKKIIQHIEDN